MTLLFFFLQPTLDRLFDNCSKLSWYYINALKEGEGDGVEGQIDPLPEQKKLVFPY